MAPQRPLEETDRCIPFAAFAMVDLFEKIRSRELSSLITPVCVLILAAFFVHLPLASEQRLAMAWYNLANKYRELERYDEAVAAYQNSIGDNPRAISTYNNLAVTYERAGRSDEAIAV